MTRSADPHQIGLASGDLGWIFGPLSQVGIALNGVAWIALGLELALRRRRVATDA